MAFTEQDLKNQKQEIARLAEELSRLNNTFAEQKKALGLPADKAVTVDQSEVGPELEHAMAEAVERAKQEGAARAAQAKASGNTESTGQGCRCRRGAMRI